MAETRLRAGVPADAAAVQGLGRVVVPATYAPIDPAYAEHVLSQWWSLEQLTSSLERLRWWVAEQDDGSGDQVVGVANLGRLDERAVMWFLYVHPDHQGTGLGRRLLHEVVAGAGPEPLWLELVVGNDGAEGFYRSQGFVEVERTRQPPYPDQLWMRWDR